MDRAPEASDRSVPSSRGRTRGVSRVEVAAVFAAWTLVGILLGSTTYFRAAAYREPIPAGQVAAHAALDMYTWALASLVVLWAARRFPLERGRLTESALALVGIGIALVIARAAVLHPILQATGWFPVRTWEQAMFSYVPHNFVTFWMLVGVAHAVEYGRRFQERELSTAQLETQLTRTQLQMLKMQIHPHFLFNTLHAISTLVHTDPGAAERMIASLSELLRSTLTHQQAQEVAVAEELALLQPYLEIEKIRLGDRLEIRLEIDPEARAARVPHLLLQPLVENAIRHGIAPRRRGGTIEIEIFRSNGRLVIRVEDDGQGFSRGAVLARQQGGVGIANTRARLQQLYGNDHRFAISSVPGSGTRIDIAVPLRLPEAAPRSALLL